MDVFTTAVTEVSVTEAADAQTNASAGMSLLLAGIALVLIYVLTVNLQKIAAAVDKLLGRGMGSDGGKAAPERVRDDEYKVYDIYEGEKNLGENDDKKE